MTHWLTPDGYNVMLRGLMGDAIKFTRIKYGNGTPGDGAWTSIAATRSASHTYSKTMSAVPVSGSYRVT